MKKVKKTRPVKEFHWEGNDLHVEFSDNGETIVYKNANVTKMHESLRGTGIVGQKMTFVTVSQQEPAPCACPRRRDLMHQPQCHKFGTVNYK